MESLANKGNQKHKSGHNPKNNLTNISKSMCYLLRHEGEKFGLKIESSGFVKLEELLSLPQIKKLRVTEEIVKEIVETDSKGRYELVNRPPMYIRAVQGHSTKSVKDEEILDQVSNIFEYPIVIHGTYLPAWDLIKQTGLNRMNRNCIHFSIGHKKDDHVISGMRGNCEVFIEINAVQAFYNQIKFYISKNKVILTPGIDGVLQTNYFKKVVDHNQNLLYCQSYEYLVIFDNLDLDNKPEITHIHVIDLIDKKLVETIKNENKETTNFLNDFSENFINNEYVKKPFIVIINEKTENNYLNFVKTNCDDLNHLSFYLEYIIDEQNNFDKIFDNSHYYNSKNIKRIEIDLKAKFGKSPNQPKVREIKISTGNADDDKQFQLTKAVLQNKSKEKNYVLMFLNFEEEDILSSIDYILIIKDGERVISNRFVLETTLIKKNLINFLDKLKQILIKENILEKLLILCIQRENLDYLKNKMKLSSIKIPQLFNRNIILLKKSDFSYLDSAESNQAAELFLMQYINSQEGIERIKILL